jgi:hypothetical protein
MNTTIKPTTLYQAVHESSLRELHRYHNFKVQCAMAGDSCALLKLHAAAAVRAGRRLVLREGGEVAVLRYRFHPQALSAVRVSTIAYDADREYCMSEDSLDRLSIALLAPAKIIRVIALDHRVVGRNKAPHQYSRDSGYCAKSVQC